MRHSRDQREATQFSREDMRGSSVRHLCYERGGYTVCNNDFTPHEKSLARIRSLTISLVPRIQHFLSNPPFLADQSHTVLQKHGPKQLDQPLSRGRDRRQTPSCRVHGPSTIPSRLDLQRATQLALQGASRRQQTTACEKQKQAIVSLQSRGVYGSNGGTNQSHEQTSESTPKYVAGTCSGQHKPWGSLRAFNAVTYPPKTLLNHGRTRGKQQATQPSRKKIKHYLPLVTAHRNHRRIASGIT